jgi:hypothetical protein
MRSNRRAIRAEFVVRQSTLSRGEHLLDGTVETAGQLLLNDLLVLGFQLDGHEYARP